MISKYIKAIALALSISAMACAQAEDRLSYIGHGGQIVYGNTIQPEITTKYYRQGNNQIVETITKSCVRINKHGSRLTCQQWKTDKSHSSSRVERFKS